MINVIELYVYLFTSDKGIIKFKDSVVEGNKNYTSVINGLTYKKKDLKQLIYKKRGLIGENKESFYDCVKYFSEKRLSEEELINLKKQVLLYVENILKEIIKEDIKQINKKIKELHHNHNILVNKNKALINQFKTLYY